MKLKFYLRGLGVGILFSVLIFSFVVIPKIEDSYTAKIEELEAELDSQNTIDISAIKATGTPSPTPTPITTPEPTPTITSAESVSLHSTLSPSPTFSPTPTPVNTLVPTNTPVPTKTPTPTVKPTFTPTPIIKPTVTPSPTVKLTVTPSPTVKPASTPEPTATVTPVPTVTQEVVSIEIEKGMSSNKVAKIIYEKGLVDSASAFNKYLVDNGYSKKVRIGTFKITVGADYKEIADIITRSR